MSFNRTLQMALPYMDGLVGVLNADFSRDLKAHQGAGVADFDPNVAIMFYTGSVEDPVGSGFMIAGTRYLSYDFATLHQRIVGDVEFSTNVPDQAILAKLIRRFRALANSLCALVNEFSDFQDGIDVCIAYIGGGRWATMLRDQYRKYESFDALTDFVEKRY